MLRMSLDDGLPWGLRVTDHDHRQSGACCFQKRTLLAMLLALCAACEPKEFHDGFETSTIDGEKWQKNMDPVCEFGIVSGTAETGEAGLRISARKGSRCKVVPRLHSGLISKFRREPVERDRWYFFSILVEDLGDTSAALENDNSIVAQWHSSPDRIPRKEEGRGPPLALRIFHDQWVITDGWDEDLVSSPGYRASNRLWSGPLETNRRTDWAFHVVWTHGRDGLSG